MGRQRNNLKYVVVGHISRNLVPRVWGAICRTVTPSDFPCEKSNYARQNTPQFHTIVDA